jgi:hypothetical protein
MRITTKLKATRNCPNEWQNSLPRLTKIIENSKLVLQLLDLMQEYTYLEIQEWNFGRLLQQHLNTLLEWQKLYWKQRGTIKWVTSGDVGTKIFIENATIRHRINMIKKMRMELPDKDIKKRNSFCGMLTSRDWVHQNTLICILTYKPYYQHLIT